MTNVCHWSNQSVDFALCKSCNNGCDVFGTAELSPSYSSCVCINRAFEQNLSLWVTTSSVFLLFHVGKLQVSFAVDKKTWRANLSKR